MLKIPRNAVNTFFENSVFIAATLLLYIPLAWARWAFGVEHWGKVRMGFWSYYNILPIFFHMYFLDTGTVMLYGVIDNSILGWLSLFMILLHLFTGPAPGLRPKRFVRKKFDPRIRSRL